MNFSNPNYDYSGLDATQRANRETNRQAAREASRQADMEALRPSVTTLSSKGRDSILENSQTSRRADDDNSDQTIEDKQRTPSELQKLFLKNKDLESLFDDDDEEPDNFESMVQSGIAHRIYFKNLYNTRIRRPQAF